jgi:hypothetical protein
MNSDGDRFNNHSIVNYDDVFHEIDKYQRRRSATLSYLKCLLPLLSRSTNKYQFKQQLYSLLSSNTTKCIDFWLMLLILMSIIQIFSLILPVPKFFEFVLESFFDERSISANNHNMASSEFAEMHHFPPFLVAQRLQSNEERHDTHSSSLNTSFAVDEEDIINPLTSPPFAIFYNIYIGHEKNDMWNGIRIVQEQLGQIAVSYAAQLTRYSDDVENDTTQNDDVWWNLPPNDDTQEFPIRKPSRPVRVYYNTIGSSIALDDQQIANQCLHRNMKCIHLKHYDQAMEDVTLQALYTFANRRDILEWDLNVQQKLESESSKVNENGSVPEDNEIGLQHFRLVYIHNKGSLHNNDGQNEKWRPALTQAVLSQECLHPPDRSCNVCGLQFWYFWTTFFPGNFWVAQSQYIRQLLPPVGFDDMMYHVTQQVKQRAEQGQFLLTMFPTDTEDTWGISRYATEHWIGSHPSLTPCDVVANPNLLYWFRPHWFERTMPKNTTFEYFAPDFAMAPRPFKVPWVTNAQQRPQILQHPPYQRMREYFLLAGHLLKWRLLYFDFYHQKAQTNTTPSDWAANALPPDNSWVYRAFPDGMLWREAVHRFGIDAVDQVLPPILDKPKKNFVFPASIMLG